MCATAALHPLLVCCQQTSIKGTDYCLGHQVKGRARVRGVYLCQALPTRAGLRKQDMGKTACGNCTQMWCRVVVHEGLGGA